jgi:GDP-4-dehydro-6-deoxy-D-mannose reductase
VRTLVTGADGFVGGWLTRHLEESGDDVWLGIGNGPPGARKERSADLTDAAAVSDLVAWAQPQAVYHLAAVSFGPEASADVGHALDVTVRGTAYLLEAVARLDPPPLVLIPSSAEVYGNGVGRWLTERAPIAPVNVYGATKAAQEMLGLAYHRAGRVPVVVARAFNHIGPGQRESFVVPAFAMQLARIAAGAAAPVLRVGNLSARRDFTDVRDVVRAYRLLVDARAAGLPVNIASGRAIAIRDVLDTLIALSELSVEVVVDPARLRPADQPVVCGSSALLRRLTGWRPRISLRGTLRDVWEDARRRFA